MPKKFCLGTLWLKTGIQVAQNNHKAYAHHLKQVSSDFEPSGPNLSHRARFVANFLFKNDCFQLVPRMITNVLCMHPQSQPFFFHDWAVL